MPMIIVTPLSAIHEAIRRYKPSAMITLLSPEHMIETPDGFPADAHLRIGVHDVSDPAQATTPPLPDHVEELLIFGRTWTGEAPLLVHCWAGISRSMATAYILLNERFGPGHELAIAKAMRARAPHAAPNPLLVKFADAQLGRQGRMVAAVESIGRGTIVAEGEIVELPISLDDL